MSSYSGACITQLHSTTCDQRTTNLDTWLIDAPIDALTDRSEQKANTFERFQRAYGCNFILDALQFACDSDTN